MPPTFEETKAAIKEFILERLLPGESPDALTDSTELVTYGVLDSLSTLQLVAFVEQRFSVTLEAHEVTPEHLNTLPDIAALVTSKLAA